MLNYLILIAGGVWGLFTLIGDFLSTKKCIKCKYNGPVDYMVVDNNGKYRHYGCQGE